VKKIKGLVLKSIPGYVYLLTPEGNYLKVACKEEVFSRGSEIEFAYPQPVRLSGYIAAAAAFFLIIAISVLIFLGTPRQEAYLALDINPSLLITLDENAFVVKVEALNADGEQLLQNLHLQGERAEKAVELILEQAFLSEYLSVNKENAIYMSLAAPGNYLLTEGVLRLLAAEKVAWLEINSYLKVREIGMERALQAMEKNISLNGIVLKDELTEKGIWEGQVVAPNEAGESDQRDQFDELALIPPVKIILERAGAENVFKAGEYVAGQKPAGEKPEHAGSSPPPKPEQETEQQQQGGNQKGQTTPPLTDDTSSGEKGEGQNGGSGHQEQESSNSGRKSGHRSHWGMFSITY
jgi:hypothetical protein